MRRAAGALLAAFVAVVVLQHVLVPRLDPAQNRISEYAKARYGPLMVAGFAAWAVALLATAAIVPRRVAAPLVAAAAGVALVAVFPTQTVAGELPPGVERTLSGRLHDLGSAVIFLAIAAAVVVTGMTCRGWFRSASAALLAFALAAQLATPVPGLVQRASLLAACAWQALLLRALNDQRPPGDKVAGRP